MYTLYHSTYHGIMVTIPFPGELWEIEFLYEDAVQEVRVEKFLSNGEIYGEEILEDIRIRKI